MVSQTEILALANILPDKSVTLSSLRELHGKGVDSVVGKLNAAKKVTVEGDVVRLVDSAEPASQGFEPVVEPVAASIAQETEGGQANNLRSFLDRLGADVVARLGHRDCVYLVERILLATAAEASDRGDLSPEVIHRLHSAAGDITALRAVID